MKLNAATMTFLVVLYGYLVSFTYVLPRIYLYVLLAIIVILSVRYIVETSKLIRPEQQWKFFATVIFILGSSVATQMPHIALALILAVVYISSKSSVKQIFFHLFLCSSAMFIITLVLYYTGVLEGNIFFRETNSERIVRSSLGFSNPNSPMLYAFPIIASGIYLFKKDVRFYLSSAAFVAFLYFTTNSRTGLIILSGTLVLSLLPKRWFSVITLHGALVKIYLLIMCGLTLAIGLLQGDNNQYNDTLSNRPFSWGQYITSGVVGGGSIEKIPMDNLYIYLVFGAGMLTTALFILIVWKGISLTLKRQDRAILSLITIATLSYGLLETSIIMASINMIIVVFLYLITDTWTVNYKSKQGIAT